MTIGFDGSRAFVNKRTGTENYSYNLLKALAAIDTENKYLVYVRPGVVIPESSTPIVIPESSASRGSSKQIDSGSKTPGMTNIRDWPKNFKFVTIPFPRFWTQIGLSIRTFLDPIGILFVPAHTFPIFHKPGLKIVMTIHDLGSEYLPDMHQLKQKLYLNFITRFQLKSATKLIAVSEATKKDLVKKIGVKPLKVKVIYEGIAQDQLKPINDDTLRDRLRIYGIKKYSYFLFVGTIQPRKNLERIIKAFAAYTKIYQDFSVKLVLAGQKGWLSGQIYELPKQLQIANQVQFLGRVDDNDVEALYKGAIALVYPSLFEGFGLPILEAMSSKCPVLTSNISSMPEVAGDAALKVDPYKTEQILEGMVKLTQDNLLRDRLIYKGNEQIKKFSWQKFAEETLKLFKSL